MEGEGNDSVIPGLTQEVSEVLSVQNKDRTSSDNSEYGSVDSLSEDEQPPIAIKVRSKASGLDSHSESEGSVILQREEGDGQESLPQKKVDDDEDKKNPQYIPKRGTFYEHDDRTAEDDNENTEENETEKAEKEGKKKVWQDKGERWSHDRFNDMEQAPKSRAELVAIYGYDIRNEDGPPRARRRRRYGRGPNKYTRNWEDEDAYVKPPTPRQKVTKKPVQPETEFPPLVREKKNRSRTKSSDSNEGDPSNFKENDENKVQNVKSLERQSSVPNEKRSIDRQTNNQLSNDVTHSDNRSNVSPRVGGTGRIVKPNREIKDSDYKGFTTKTRQTRGVRTDSQKVLPPRKKENNFIQTQNFTNKSSNNHQIQVADMEKEINKLSLQEKNNKTGAGNYQQSNRQGGSVPPRLQNQAVDQQKGPKRYSSMRQRSLPETGATPPVPQPTNFTFYPSDYNSTAPPPATTQPILAAQGPVAVSSAPPPPQLIPAAYPPPQAYAPQAPSAAAFLQTAPPPFISAPPTAPPPQIVSYVTQAPPTFVPGYQGHTFNTVAQPTDLYQPQGGITYYTAEQQVVQRAAPQKRAKAAIPIVAPPTDFKEKEDFNTETASAVQE
ncbi:protein CASC3-like isoform X2 [Anthonomus grandis grandis]|uniref:protein CASC3-like isoform X2 n=1 Tax=Anthonomus grandis grandis TaxID=2921223 RepID=UPI0021652847|nr:protein CASC3-like isoform X2 [Anthonomus grandis grandis]